MSEPMTEARLSEYEALAHRLTRAGDTSPGPLAELVGEIRRLRGELAARPAEAYPGELGHLRDFLRAAERRSAPIRPGWPDAIGWLLVDHYSDVRWVDRPRPEDGGHPE